MKKISFYILITFMILVGGVTLFAPEVASAKEAVSTDFPGINCALFSPTDWDSCIALLGYYVFFIPTSWVLIVAGALFDTMLAFSLSTNTLNQTFIIDAWKIVRDVANLFFIFILLYIAIGTILQTGGDTLKRALVNVIIVALVINFSFFFTRVVIDASNIFALEFYNKIGSVTESPHVGALITVPERSISAGFVSAFDPQKIISADTFKAWQGHGYSKNILFVLFLAGAIINLFTAYVFFLAGFLMVARVIAFMFLIISSPLAFMAYIVPSKSGYAQQWWSQLTNQALVAPVFLFFIYVITKMIAGDGNGTGFIDNVFSGATNLVDIIINMSLQGTVLVVALMMGLKAAQKLSGEAGAQIGKLSNPVANRMANATKKYAKKAVVGTAMAPVQVAHLGVGAGATWVKNKMTKGKPTGREMKDEDGNIMKNTDGSTKMETTSFASRNPWMGAKAMNILERVGGGKYEKWEADKVNTKTKDAARASGLTFEEQEQARETDDRAKENLDKLGETITTQIKKGEEKKRDITNKIEEAILSGIESINNSKHKDGTNKNAADKEIEIAELKKTIYTTQEEEFEKIDAGISEKQEEKKKLEKVYKENKGGADIKRRKRAEFLSNLEGTERSRNKDGSWDGTYIQKNEGMWGSVKKTFNRATGIERRDRKSALKIKAGEDGEGSTLEKTVEKLIEEGRKKAEKETSNNPEAKTSTPEKTKAPKKTYTKEDVDQT